MSLSLPVCKNERRPKHWVRPGISERHVMQRGTGVCELLDTIECRPVRRRVGAGWAPIWHSFGTGLSWQEHLLQQQERDGHKRQTDLPVTFPKGRIAENQEDSDRVPVEG